jgi:tRNA(adenine34) deaminase
LTLSALLEIESVSTHNDHFLGNRLIMLDLFWMREALAQAQRAAELGEVPIGAVMVYQPPGQSAYLLATGYNQPIATLDPSSHAEVVAIRRACKRQSNYRLAHCVLYTTLEPCMMCWGAIAHARVQRVVYGATDSKYGGIYAHWDHLKQMLPRRCAVEGGVLAEPCRALLQSFFQEKRKCIHARTQ